MRVDKGKPLSLTGRTFRGAEHGTTRNRVGCRAHAMQSVTSWNDGAQVASADSEREVKELRALAGRLEKGLADTQRTSEVSLQQIQAQVGGWVLLNSQDFFLRGAWGWVQKPPPPPPQKKKCICLRDVQPRVWQCPPSLQHSTTVGLGAEV
jgi:hypothetical protein